MGDAQLRNLVGQRIFVCTTLVELDKQKVGGRSAAAILKGVETGGIWAEHEGLAGDLSTQFGVRLSQLPKAVAQIFLPYSSVVFVAALTPKGEEGPVQ